MSVTASNARVPTVVNFIIGGISGIVSQVATHPMDVLKIRMQLSQNTLRDTTLDTFRANGIPGFYVGLSAAILRQLTYTTTRLGVYATLLDIGEGRFGQLNYVTMVSLGMIAGVMGSFVGTPTDLILVRMIYDMNLPLDKRKNYRNAVSGIMEIWKNEGFTRLWRGAVPTMARAALVNGTQLGTYTKSKIMLKDTGLTNGLLLQSVAAMMSGVATSLVSLPVDAAKTRIQSWKQPTKPPGIILMVFYIVKKEGATSLWRGFLPYYSRAGPNTIITMVCLDQLHRLYREFYPLE